MKDIALPHGRLTSQLGFGCTVLKGGPDRAAQRALLDTALAEGIRHFDIAPSYGLGVAEGILGEFLKGRRDQVSVTSKVGLPRPKNPGALAQARALLRPLLSLTPALRRRLGKSAQRMSGSGATRFDLPHVRQSVAESLRELGTDYLDVLLLHEITPADVTDELRRYLEDGVSSGMFLSYGTGSYRHQAEAVVSACPDLCAMVQTSWTAGDADLALEPHSPLISTHGAVRPVDTLLARLKGDDRLRQRLSEIAEADLGDKRQLGNLMLAAAIANNPDGIVLVSTTRADRIAANRRIAEDAALIERGGRFHRALLEAA